MITVTETVKKKIIAHAKLCLPIEACGYLAGKKGIISHCIEMTNVDNSPEHFSFDPAEQFRALKEARTLGLEIMANYHSHPASPARPSQEDIKLAYDPNIIYFIVSLAQITADLKAFKIQNGAVTPIEIKYIQE